MGHLITATFHYFSSLQTFGAFLSMLIENIGVPLPTEIGYLISQDLISRGIVSYGAILFILTLGHVLGSLISYGIGRMGDNYIKTKVEKSKRIVEVHQKLKGWYKKYGSLTVFLTRFVGYVRPWSSYIAGLAKVEFWPFLLWTTLGSFIFNIINIYFAKVFLLIWRRYEVYHYLIIIIALLLFFAAAIYEFFKYLKSLRKKKT
ncbi:hypothetical protein COT78_01805 [Candidatus Berkelbacteria bacterium CG10_big_fil_rev_8_21_14_0_10_43_13]|uniref:VTT domain-containing protein n=1 Tax=Candidatus Berkelbacteria bacterium CG10_big_fil_rev_8_21_14_0_10_43_13 TaxID=1974514 RepID=A0A2H0W6R5_9BACT|nr:MAG: hypothetical protein COT78_01805 [Candidatus Berkelbacteria bacterium CG10_big_fil_rev_8_21_14_0_10_43_13]